MKGGEQPHSAATSSFRGSDTLALSRSTSSFSRNLARRRGPSQLVMLLAPWRPVPSPPKLSPRDAPPEGVWLLGPYSFELGKTVYFNWGGGTPPYTVNL